jgi:hypothetical protein
VGKRQTTRSKAAFDKEMPSGRFSNRRRRQEGKSRQVSELVRKKRALNRRQLSFIVLFWSTVKLVSCLTAEKKNFSLAFITELVKQYKGASYLCAIEKLCVQLAVSDDVETRGRECTFSFLCRRVF